MNHGAFIALWVAITFVLIATFITLLKYPAVVTLVPDTKKQWGILKKQLWGLLQPTRNSWGRCSTSTVESHDDLNDALAYLWYGSVTQGLDLSNIQWIVA